MSLLVALALLFSFNPRALSQPLVQPKLETRLVHTFTDEIKPELGRFSVPENYREPSRKRIDLAFIRFRTTASNPGAPILFLAGGPGTSGIDYASGPRFEPFLVLRQFGDIIALDQRGTGLSKPNLNCPRKFSYPTDRSANRKTFVRAYQKFAGSCAQYWRRKGVDLSAYNTETSADDVKELSKNLGDWRLLSWASLRVVYAGDSVLSDLYRALRLPP